MKTLALSILGAAAIAGGAVLANAPAGSAAPRFTAPDLSGKAVNLADYQGKTVVLEWHNPDCPFVQKHYRSGNMQALQKKYASDVVWLSVNSNDRDSSSYLPPVKLAALLKEAGAAPADYLVDSDGKVASTYAAKTTPHMFIIDTGGKVVYNGAIDDKRSTNLEDVKTAKNYVAAALDEIKAGKPVTIASTTPYGCAVKYR